MKLKLRQQPEKARMCGFSDITSRGVINPPLIIQLEDYEPGKQYLCHVLLIDDRNCDFRNLIAKPDKWRFEFEKSKRYKVFDCLFGNTTIVGMELEDTNEQPGMFFIFPDLSIRAQGFYRLLCTVVDLQQPFQSAEIITDIISVYDSKSFPGANPPSDISRWFHKQGVMIGGGPYGRKIKPKN